MENVFEPKKHAGKRAGRIWSNKIVLLDGEGIRNEQTRIARREDVGGDSNKLHKKESAIQYNKVTMEGWVGGGGLGRFKAKCFIG